MESLDGDFELRSPVSRNSISDIRVEQDGRTKRYNIRLSNALYGEGRTLADALHALANRLDGLKVYGSEEFDPEELRGSRVRLCDYCGAKIFFAKTPNEKWMPLDGTSLNVTSVMRRLWQNKPVERIRCWTIIDIGGTPTIRSLSKPEGQVWIAHPDVCGINDTEPLSTDLLARWLPNRKVVETRQTEHVADLENVIRDLQ